VKPRLALAVMAATLLASAAPAAPAPAVPDIVDQGALVVARVAPGSRVQVGGRDVRVAPDGTFVFGVARDATGRVPVKVTAPDAGVARFSVRRAAAVPVPALASTLAVSADGPVRVIEPTFSVSAAPART